MKQSTSWPMRCFLIKIQLVACDHLTVIVDNALATGPKKENEEREEEEGGCC